MCISELMTKEKVVPLPAHGPTGNNASLAQDLPVAEHLDFWN